MVLSKSFPLEANLVDLIQRKMGYGTLVVKDGRVEEMKFTGPVNDQLPFILPGFIDAHIHIESSMLTPPAFARMAVRHGTVATVSDPHEIANVCGIDGVRYMVELGRQSGFKFFFGAPSCVPATSFETAGSTLPVEQIIELFKEKNVSYLSEMMNYPAVLSRDPLVMDKIKAARDFHLPVDGHAPGLRGKDASRYASAGISTDHECTTLEEALDKIEAGMQIIIREGSAAKNYNALHTLIRSHPDRVMFCSDDKHPDDLIRGHINQLVTRSLSLGYDLMDILTIACVNPVKHYKLNVGLLQPGDPADMIMVDKLDPFIVQSTINLTQRRRDAENLNNRDYSFHIESTWIGGEKVFDRNTVHLPPVHIPSINSFGIGPIDPSSLKIHLKAGPAKIIVAVDGAIVTGQSEEMMSEGNFESDTNRDILKIVVINRYYPAPPAIALIHGFGLKQGAIASSVAHDSHNIVAVGTDDNDLAACINQVIHQKGGVSASLGKVQKILPLPIGGLMSDGDAETVGHAYEALDHFVKQQLGSTLSAPFMTLSFMALLVIPSLKLSDKGLFDGSAFQFTSLQPIH